MDKYIGIKYKLKSSENFEEYMKFIEIGLISRKAAMAVTPICVLTKNDDNTYTYTMNSIIKTITVTFRLGEEFIEERADGKKVKSIIVADGDKLIQTQIEDNGRKSTHVREFTPELITVTSTAEGWDKTCVRIYVAV